MASGEFDLEFDEKALKFILGEYVEPIVKKILIAHIDSDIYGAYSPKPYAWIGGETYSRHMSLSPGSIISEIEGNTLYVTSDAEPESLWGGGISGPGAFLAVLEAGNMGAWSRVTGKSLPRPALSNAQADADSSQAIQDAIEKGIKKYFKLR